MEKLIIEDIKGSIEQHLTANGFFLVDLQLVSGTRIRVLADGPDGIRISDCSKLCRELQELLGEEVCMHYEVEVSSPGLDNPFRVYQQYRKYVGKPIRVKTKEGKEIVFRLLNADEQGIEGESVKEKASAKKSNEEPSKYGFTYNEIQSAYAVIQFGTTAKDH